MRSRTFRDAARVGVRSDSPRFHQVPVHVPCADRATPFGNVARAMIIPCSHLAATSRYDPHVYWGKSVAVTPLQIGALQGGGPHEVSTLRGARRAGSTAA